MAKKKQAERKAKKKEESSSDSSSSSDDSSDSDSDSESAQKDPPFLFQRMSIINGDIAVVSFSGSVRGSLSSVSTPIQFCYK